MPVTSPDKVSLFAEGTVSTLRLIVYLAAAMIIMVIDHRGGYRGRVVVGVVDRVVDRDRGPGVDGVLGTAVQCRLGDARGQGDVDGGDAGGDDIGAGCRRRGRGPPQGHQEGGGGPRGHRTSSGLVHGPTLLWLGRCGTSSRSSTADEARPSNQVSDRIPRGGDIHDSRHNL